MGLNQNITSFCSDLKKMAMKNVQYYLRFFLFLFWITQPPLSDTCKAEVHSILFRNRNFQLENVKTKCSDFSKCLSSLFYPLLFAEFKKLFWFLKNVIVWTDLLFAFFCLICYLCRLCLCRNSVQMHSFVQFVSFLLTFLLFLPLSLLFLGLG